MFSLFQKITPADAPVERLMTVSISSITPNPNQPRRTFEPCALRELSESISRYGLLQPILVRDCGDSYELIAGERRWRACMMAGLTDIDVIISQVGSAESACIAIVENIQRENLHFFEEAESYISLMSIYGMTQESLAKQLGKSQSAIANKLRILRLESSVKEIIIANNLTERHARALLRLTDEPSRLSALNIVNARSLSVKETEDLVEKILSEKPERKGKILPFIKDYRLFVNTVKASVETLKKAGVNACYDVEESEDQILVKVYMPKITR